GVEVARVATAEIARMAESVRALLDQTARDGARAAESVRALLDETVRSTADRIERGVLGAAAAAERKLAPLVAAEAEQLAALREATAAAGEHASGAAEEAADRIARAAAAALGGIERGVGALAE